MKTNFLLIASLLLLAFTSCKKTENEKPEIGKVNTESSKDFYFNYSVDGKNFDVAEDDILTTYNQFSADAREFRILAGKDGEPSLILTITSDMSKHSSTPNGSQETGNILSQGSVSLQNYPEKGLTFNSYDAFLTPAPEVIPSAITITKSEAFKDQGRIITGTIDVIVRGGENKKNDLKVLNHTIKGNFRVKHLFNGSTAF